MNREMRSVYSTFTGDAGSADPRNYVQRAWSYILRYTAPQRFKAAQAWSRQTDPYLEVGCQIDIFVVG